MQAVQDVPKFGHSTHLGSFKHGGIFLCFHPKMLRLVVACSLTLLEYDLVMRKECNSLEWYFTGLTPCSIEC